MIGLTFRVSFLLFWIILEVINHMFLFFKLLQLRERGSSNRPTSQSGLAPLQNAPGFAYPRVDSAPDDG